MPQPRPKQDPEETAHASPVQSRSGSGRSPEVSPGRRKERSDRRKARGGPRWREHVRSKPGVSHAYRVGVFIAGLACIAGGIALAVLPGPLTIPPILLGLWLWSTEFRFADHVLDSFKEKAGQAWAHAKRQPVSSALITIAGLAAAAAAFWAVGHFELVGKARDAVGI